MDYMTEHDPQQRLVATGLMKDGDIDLALVALYLAELSHPGISLERYAHHLRKTGDEVAARHAALLAAGAEDTVETRLAALKHVIADTQGMAGDEADYDNIENADLIRVIDRRRGMPIALSILYLDGGRAGTCRG
jgi:regulator of sirC expression with transglutaminase-like and TPR domain